MEKKVKIYTWFNPPPVNCEVNTEPSLTDESFFEPLNTLVERIIRGESTTFIDAYKGEFDYDSDDDAILDNPESDLELDDLTDIDLARDVVKNLKTSNFSKEKLRSQVTASAGDATESASVIADGERRETADGNQEEE